MTEDVRTDFDSPTNPTKVIRLKCRDCTNNQVTEIDNCTVKTCPLFAWRFGKNPYRAKVEMSAERKEQMGNHLKKARLQKGVQPQP